MAAYESEAKRLESWPNLHGQGGPYLARRFPLEEKSTMIGDSKRILTLTPQEFAHFGGSSLAYVKTIRSEDARALFPQAPAIQPGLKLFALLGADGTPIMLTDSRDEAIANAWKNQLEMVSLH
jgi:hypothetical protein